MMQRIRVKICGLRQPDDALEISRMGADAIGLVLADSPRRVTVAQARAVTEVLAPSVAAVGVFVNSGADEINRVTSQARLALVQLHGAEPPEIVDDLAVPCIKAFAVRNAGWIDGVRSWLDAVRSPQRVAAILLDAYDPKAAGGTGRRFNGEWVAQARSAGRMQGLAPLMLSGGLDANVVSAAIRIVRPWAVDVSSGVESAPGIKDLAKVEAFIRAALKSFSDLDESPGGCA